MKCSNPGFQCLNGGSCTVLSAYTAKCDCPTAFSGNQCEIG